MTCIEIKNLKTWFPIKKGLLQKVTNHVKAVDGVSLNIPKGKTLALVGESGCGKTTVGKSIVGLVKPNSGEILFEDIDLCKSDKAKNLDIKKKIQMVFQDPANSLDPRMLVKDIVGEGLNSLNLTKNREDYHKQVKEMLDLCGLGEDAMNRYPHEFSGGQRQRICIARALIVKPDFIVCDEPTSALDVSVQASILNLLKSLQDRFELTYLFITHDLSVVEHIADRVAVMYLGQIVEEQDKNSLFDSPAHPYTKALLKSAPTMDINNRSLEPLTGDVPSPIDPPNYCRFYGRCQQKEPRCKLSAPDTYSLESGTTRCFLFEKKQDQ